MTKEDKELVLKDLCGRLPYRPYIQTKRFDFPVELTYISLDSVPTVKPYLRSASKMTEIEERQMYALCGSNGFANCIDIIDYLYAHHIDVHGLIPKGLAIEADDDMYLNTYDIWAEGFLDQGMEGIPQKAQYVGQAQGHTFAEACEFWYLNNVPRKEFEKYFRVTNGKPSYWVNLYDNEEDAKKAFG